MNKENLIAEKYLERFCDVKHIDILNLFSSFVSDKTIELMGKALGIDKK